MQGDVGLRYRVVMQGDNDIGQLCRVMMQGCDVGCCRIIIQGPLCRVMMQGFDVGCLREVFIIFRVLQGCKCFMQGMIGFPTVPYIIMQGVVGYRRVQKYPTEVDSYIYIVQVVVICLLLLWLSKVACFQKLQQVDLDLSNYIHDLFIYSVTYKL